MRLLQFCSFASPQQTTMPRKPTKATARSTVNSGNMLSAVARLSEAERRLTQTLDKTSRYLPNSADPLLLPAPQSMEEVKTVLAVARTYADRTSAPSGWNPNVPIYGFVTPNPLPHQLRGGQLAALQLQQAQEDRERKRRAVREEQENKKRKQKKRTEEMERERRAAEEAADHDGDVKMEDAEEADAAVVDPKRRELDVMHEREDMVGEEGKVPQTEEEAARKERQRQAQREREARQKAVAAAAASATSRRREVPATMNLSESSSSSEEEESDDESE